VLGDGAQPVLPDPHDLGAAMALGIAFVPLEGREWVEPVIGGQIEGLLDSAVLPGRRVILSDEAAGA
jgi:hypothetical protein